MRLLKELVRPGVLNLKSYSSARDEYSGTDGIFLDANENPFGELNRYPDPGQKKLKAKLAALKSVSVDSVFIGNGSDEIIDLAFRIFCEPGRDKALTFSPTYGMYEVSAAINGVELIHVPLNSDFQIDVEATKKHLKDASVKLIFSCSPNNPTGNSLLEIEQILKAFDGIVMVDEAYIDFSENSSWINRLKEYPNLVVVQTFSKAWGLAAARIGVAYADPELIGWFNRVKPPYNVSGLNQRAALEALENADQTKAQIQLLKTEKQKLVAGLRLIKPVIRIYPSDANFILVEVTDANAVYDYLVCQKIVARNRNSVVKNCLRITVGSPEENVQLVNALKMYQS
ncbi:MAG: histidinol-phosphate transaminase [Bacteroidetes bacterium]|nr:histidinol-phosphate transaminase [Bacteroidota bacterium]